MSKKIVVMGGSFNPPTIAHQKLMLLAVDSLNAEKGIFVPSSHKYVKTKMEKTDGFSKVIDENTRFQMLCKMAEDDSRLLVDDCEYHTVESGHTYETMLHLQEKYPDYQIYFVVGGDKLGIIPRWRRIKEFLDQFNFLVTDREEFNAEEKLNENDFLRLYKDKFSMIDSPSDINRISSSAVRKAWKKGDFSGMKDMLHTAVYEMMKDLNVIDTFRGKYFFLSNFYETPITYKGLTYENAEAAFQAQKCLSEEEKIPFTEYKPAESKKMGREVQLREDWETVKLSFMEEIVRAKFSQNEELKTLLLETENASLIEGNSWNDVFWGVDLKTGKGENHLGKILMKIREELKQKTEII